MAELIIIIFLIICHIVAGFTMISERKYTGEFEGFFLSVENEYIVGLLISTIIGYFLLLFIYKYTKNKKIFMLKGKRFFFNKKRFSYIYLFFTIIQIIFFLFTGVGKVGGDATSPISFIFSMFNVNCLFGLYYFICRNSNNRAIYFVNIVLFCVLQLMKGWTGFVLSIFFYELYYYFKRNPINSILNYAKVLFFPVIAILIGGKIYQYLHSYKNLIRLNAEIENTYLDGITLLLSRLSFFPIAVGAYQNTNLIKDLYYFDYLPLREIQALFRPLTPGFIMPDKDFRIIGNLVVQSFHPYVTSTTSSNFGIISYLQLLFNVNIADFLIYIIVSVLLLILVKSLFDSVEEKKGDLNFLYFILLLNMYEIGSLEMVFGYGILPIVFFIPLFIIFKVVIIKRV
jgi:hypothetical protein